MPYIQKHTLGLFSIAICSSTAADLAYLLDPSVPLVHLSNFGPKRDTGWWDTDLLLSPGGAYSPLRIRMLAFDVEIPTAEFLASLGTFEPHGLDLLQVRKSVSPNMAPQLMRQLPKEQLTKMLLDGGMEARFTLPHPGEVAVFASRSTVTLNRALENEDIRSRCIEVASGTGTQPIPFGPALALR